MFKVISVGVITGGFMFMVSSMVHAAEIMMDHSQMGHSQESSAMQTESTVMPYANSGNERKALTMLDAAPASGKAREVGFDNSYNMKQTTTIASLAEKCALASRGIIMLGRASWKQCGVKVKELPKSSSMQQHSGH